MKLDLLKILVLTEARLRLRRLSTVVLLLVVIALSWAMIPDPAGGMAMITAHNVRVQYSSSALALGSAALAGVFLFSLAGFYLVRGRMAEDMRSGAGAVIAATPVGNGFFLLCRWLGGVVFLVALMLAFLGSMLVCHALRGEASLQPGVYLQTYALLLLPSVLFSVACAVLFDSCAPLMGKGGDLLFFILWMAQIALMAELDQGRHADVFPLMLFDFSGLVLSMLALQQHLHTTSIAVGGGTFDPALAPLVLPAGLWSAQMIWLRCATAMLALLPLLPASLLFHRYAPDRVKAARSRRRSPLAWLNAALRPLSGLVQPLFRLAAVLPGFGGQVAGELALTLAATPATVAALLLALPAALLAPAAALPGILIAAVACWGILVSDLSTRDFAAGCAELNAAAAGGIARRYLRQLAATVALGALFMGIIALRWSFAEPLRAAALASGLLSLSALATLLGRCSRTGRTFLALFLFGLYVALSARQLPMLDAFGFNGVATAGTIMSQLLIAVLAGAGGYLYNHRRAG